MNISNFDVIVLGDSISALVAASFLCKNGYRVLILTEDEAKISPPFFDESATTFVSGYAPNKLLYNAFRELGVPVHRQRKFKNNELSYQVAIPDYRVDVGNSWTLYNQELKREFFSDASSIDAVYNEVSKCDKILNEIFYQHLLYPQKLSARIKKRFIMFLEDLFKINVESCDLSEIVSPNLTNSPFKEMLEAQIKTLSSSSKKMPNMAALFLLGAYQRGVAQNINELDFLRETLKEQISLTHGEFLNVKGIENIYTSNRNPFKDKKGIVIKFKADNKIVESKFLVYGYSLFSLQKMLKGIKVSGGFKKLMKKFAPKGAKLTFAYNIDRRGIPVGFKSRVIFVPTNGSAKNTFLVSISVDEETSECKQKCLLNSSIEEPFLNGTIKKERIKELYNETTTALKELIPFFDDFVKPINDLKFEDINLDELKHGDFTFDASFLRKLSLGEVQNCETLKNIYFTGREFLPQLGFEGDVASGWRTANVIINKFKNNKF